MPKEFTMEKSLNVLGEPLQPCSLDPMTGFFRNGKCDTCADDHGSHTVCAVMTKEFLAWSKYVGNDLSTPVEEYSFPGLSDGDDWCLCAARFLQAYRDGEAPKVRLVSTHVKALEIVPLNILKECAIDLN